MISLNKIQEKKDWIVPDVSFKIPLTQAWFYGDIQKKTGRNVIRFLIKKNNNNIGFVQFIEYSLFQKKVYWYAPYGPLFWDVVSQEELYLFKESIKKILCTDCVFVRLDPSPLLSGPQEKKWKKAFGNVALSSYKGAYFQPRLEWYTDIQGSDESILSHMHQKTRYSVRLAEKRGVAISIIKKDFDTALADFLVLMEITSERNNFSLHNDVYYANFFQSLEEDQNGFIIEARYKGLLLASHCIVIVSGVAHYVFGASSNIHRDVCAPYLLHFRAMQESRAQGACFYNFGAIAEEGGAEWQTLSVFKKKFGGKKFRHDSFFDVVVHPLWYYIYILRKFIKHIL